MNELVLTWHGRERMAQRGFNAIDLALLLRFGVETADGVAMTRKHAAAAAKGFRELAERTERLADVHGVVQDDRLVTIYRPGKEKRKRLLRGVPHSEWED
ncbi:hypothetical protein [Elioraea sp.]|jgi:hypothetical protein|uniref:hypothetical protein n=1 Tax=Elioraea sp. TaxID=2185103 RepID=UPI0021DE80E9|nr:hypothetical protein [Elioraea sp.]GIX09063.1 MAG: hypothetical protein KatS3mg116_0773 [Elioraea sp.]